MVVRELKGPVLPEFANTGMRNIAGEVQAAMLAFEWLRHRAKQPHMHFDYLGIREWATERWTASKPMTRLYQEFFGDLPFRRVWWHHHKGHTGVYYNERAHQLAHEARLAEKERRLTHEQKSVRV